MRRIMNQCAWAAARTKGSYFEALFQHLVPRLGLKKAIWAVAHHLLRIVWRILHVAEHYQEHGVLASQAASIERRFRRVAKQMASLGYTIQLTGKPAAPISL